MQSWHLAENRAIRPISRSRRYTILFLPLHSPFTLLSLSCSCCGDGCGRCKAVKPSSSYYSLHLHRCITRQPSTVHSIQSLNVPHRQTTQNFPLPHPAVPSFVYPPFWYLRACSP